LTEEAVMKTGKIVMLFVGTLLASSALTEERMMTIPNIEQVKRIRVHSGIWMADFRSDGSAGLRWGALPIDNAAAPVGSFVFEEIYNLLVLHLNPNQVYNEDINVVFETIISNRRHTVGGGDVEDTGTIRKIMYGLRDKAVNRDEERFQNALRQCPLVRGDDADGNPIPGYVRTPYVKMPECLDPFADDPPAPKDGNTENATPQEARETVPDNGKAQTPLPDREAVRPDAPDSPNSNVATASLPLVDEAQRLEAVVTMGAPPSRLWLYAGILSTLCAGVVLWRIRRKK